MDRQIHVTVHHGDRAFRTAIEPDHRTDELLLRSVYHFGIDPEEKGDFELRHRDASRGRGRLVLNRPASDQVDDGDELELDRDTGDHHKLSTGSY